MKTRNWLLLTLMIALLLAACQPSATPTPAQTEAPTQVPAVETEAPAVAATQPVEQNTPSGEQPYPGQESAPPPQPETETNPAPYPGGEPETVDWSEAEATLNRGEVAQVYQARDLTVTLTLKDGRTLVTTEPAFDEVRRVIEQCGTTCSDISISSESQ